MRNYPWYKGWQDSFAKQGVTIIGIHTPEGEHEKDLEAVRKKTRENGFAFPVLVDTQKKNWDAWGNSMWPSTYLIDREGDVRYWWYGELNWEGQPGEQRLRQRIQELLDEPAQRTNS